MSAGQRTVKVKCRGYKNIKISKLIEFQGNLKELNPVSYDKFKANLLRLGFSEPVLVWEQGRKHFIINGHQRIKTLKLMEGEGIEIPKELPVNYVEARDIREAKLKVLSMASEYGIVTEQGLMEFIKEANIDKDELLKYFTFTKINLAKLLDKNLESYIELENPGADAYGKVKVIEVIFEAEVEMELVKQFFGEKSKILNGDELVKAIEGTKNGK